LIIFTALMLTTDGLAFLTSGEKDKGAVDDRLAVCAFGVGSETRSVAAANPTTRQKSARMGRYAFFLNCRDGFILRP
jgi:hypothetical protein